MAFRLAFYRGTRPGIPGLYNRLVRARGRGQYSHVEMVFSDGLSASSSFADGGVRFKKIDYSADHWDFVDLPAELEHRARRYFEGRVGIGYDIMGNVHLILGFLSHSQNRLFCSEAIMAALGFDEAWRFEPNACYVAVRRLVELIGLYSSVTTDLQSRVTQGQP
jgi:hypothetical protein